MILTYSSYLNVLTFSTKTAKIVERRSSILAFGRGEPSAENSSFFPFRFHQELRPFSQVDITSAFAVLRIFLQLAVAVTALAWQRRILHPWWERPPSPRHS